MKWIAKFRAILYKHGLIAAIELPAFTISVGNLSWGGTGKSPFVSILANFFLAKKISCVLLSRGYGRKEKSPVVLAGGLPISSSDQLGDEPWMIRSRNPMLGLVIHPRRALVAKHSWAKLGNPQLALLDDGFQHWRAMRDLDIVMIDASEPLPSEDKSVIRWRESPKALGRADLVILTHASEIEKLRLQKWREEIRGFRKKASLGNPWKRAKYSLPNFEILDCGYRFSAFREGKSGKEVHAQECRDSLLITGIAKPANFSKMVKAQGVNPKEEILLRDHGDLNEALRRRLKKEKPLVLLTEKDWARWREFFLSEKIPVIIIEVELEFSLDSQEKLNSILEMITKCIISP